MKNQWVPGAVWTWLKHALKIESDTIKGQTLDFVTEGASEFDLDVVYVEGTTAQELIAGSIAQAALHALLKEMPHGSIPVEHQMYKVKVRCQVTFEKEDGTYTGPVFDAKALANIVNHIYPKLGKL